MSGAEAVLPRIEGLDAAVQAARGRLPELVLDQAAATVHRARERLQVSTRHTVVALAGATGSGKSTLFNALAGSALSRSGPERPTTAQTTALVCGAEEVDGLLDWLDVPAPRRHRRGPDAPATHLPDGLVLLDLPDHDSVETAHHAEAERVLALADLLVWVVDPQKYADAALHHRLIQPHARHREVMMVVLNHIDTVPEDRRRAMVRDVRTVLAADGIRDPLVLSTSARHGTGLSDLRAAIRHRVEEKQSVALRVAADLATRATQLQEAAGEAALSVPPLWSTQLHQRLAEAAGVPGRAEDAARVTRADVRARLQWRPARPSGSSPGSAASPIDRRAVEAACRDLADKVTHDLAGGWGVPIRTAAVVGAGRVAAGLEVVLATAVEPPLPAWVDRLRPARTALAAAAVVALVLLGVLAVAGPGAGSVAGVLASTLLVLAVAGLVALSAGADALATRAAAARARSTQAGLTAAIGRAATEQVVRPVNAELSTYARFTRGLTAARA